MKKSENFKNNELKNLSPLSTDESDSQSFWDSLQSTSYSLPIPEFSEDILSKGPKGPKNPKGFKISIKNVNPFSYLFIKSPYHSRKMDSSGKDYAIDGSIVDKIAPLWLYKETLPLAPVLSLIMLSHATRKDPDCFPRKIGLPEKVCFPANVCYYLSELSPSVREARFSSYYPSKPGHGSYARYFSVKAITHEYWLQICALCMLLAMASENLAARNKAGGKIHTQCSLRWNIHEQAVLFSLLIATPFDILLNWKELAEQFLNWIAERVFLPQTAPASVPPLIDTLCLVNSTHSILKRPLSFTFIPHWPPCLESQRKPTQQIGSIFPLL